MAVLPGDFEVDFERISLTAHEDDLHFVSTRDRGKGPLGGLSAYTLPASVSGKAFLSALTKILSEMDLKMLLSKGDTSVEAICSQMCSRIGKTFPQLDPRVGMSVSLLIINKFLGGLDTDLKPYGNRTRPDLSGADEASVTTGDRKSPQSETKQRETSIAEEVDAADARQDVKPSNEANGEESVRVTGDDGTSGTLKPTNGRAKRKRLSQKTRRERWSWEGITGDAGVYGYNSYAKWQNRDNAMLNANYVTLMEGMTFDIRWKVKCSENDARQIDVAFSPKRKGPTFSEISLIIRYVMDKLFERNFPAITEKNRLDMLVVCQGFKPIAVWSGNHEEFPLDHFVAEAEKKLRECEGVSLDVGVTVRILEARGPIRPKRTLREKVELYMRVKNCSVLCRNDDHLGVARAILISLYQPRNENHPNCSYFNKSASKNNLVLSRQAAWFQSLAGVQRKPNATTEDFEAFHRVLPLKYRLVVLKNPWSLDILFAGPNRESNLYIFPYEELVYAVTCVRAFYFVRKYCGKCLKGCGPNHSCP